VSGSIESAISIQSDLGAPVETRRMAVALIPLMYQDLRRIARRERMRVRAGATLQTTALVHEAYLKLEHLASFNDDDHFLRASALAMRHILVNHARYRMAGKRGGGAANISIDDLPEISETPDEVIVKINEVLLELAQFSPRLAQESRSLIAADRGHSRFHGGDGGARKGMCHQFAAPRMQLAIDLKAVRRIEHHEALALHVVLHFILERGANRLGDAHLVGIDLGVTRHRQDVVVARDEPSLDTLVEVHGVLRTQALVIRIRVLHDLGVGEGITAQRLHA